MMHRLYNIHYKLLFCPYLITYVRRKTPNRPFGQEGGRVAGWFRYETKLCGLSAVLD